ncbi:MAG: Aspartyl-tRNA(Asn) amidotransferase subunit C @ Glutamyl-tRNA(Gln) amidotransferase subunit C, partial [uncultured Solirubrobacteraceae bacterium]
CWNAIRSSTSPVSRGSSWPTRKSSGCGWSCRRSSTTSRRSVSSTTSTAWPRRPTWWPSRTRCARTSPGRPCRARPRWPRRPTPPTEGSGFPAPARH